MLLRVILGQPNALVEWQEVESGVTSALVEVECLRTLDRLKLKEGASDAEVAARCEAVYRLIDETHVIEVSRSVLERASRPLPTPLGTLDAIQLSSALLWRERQEVDLVMATHDTALAVASRACGLSVVGV